MSSSDSEPKSIDKKTMLKICKYGEYYNPASSHHGGGKNINVMCDKCYKDKLEICIGYENYDLCLSCNEEINKIKNKITPKRSGPIRMRMRARQYR